MVRQWLGLKQDYQSTQLLAASLGTTPSAVAPKVESAEEARQAFRDLFNEEIQRQGGVLLSDADGVEKTKSDFDFNPTYLLGLLGLAGGGGGGAAAIKPVIALLSGNVVKGYLQGAVVWRDGNGDGKFNWNDTNQNGIVDTNEVIGDFFALTDSQGRFSNLGGTGAINVFGGVDLYGTGLAFNGVLSAPDATSNAVITPLTTIVQAMSLPGESATDAATRVIKLLGLDQNPALGIKASDLLTVDPISLALTGGADSVKALTIYGKAAQVANLLVAGTSAVQKAYANAGIPVTTQSQLQAADLVLQSIATTIKNQQTPVELSGALGQSFVQNVLGVVQTNLGTTANLSTVVSASDLATAVSNINDKFNDLALSANTAKQSLTALVQTEYLVQNDISSAIQNQTLNVANYTPEAINVRMDQVSSVVGSIAAPTAGQRLAPTAISIADIQTSSANPTAYLNSEYVNAHSSGVTVKVSLSSDVLVGDKVRVFVNSVGIVDLTLVAADVSSKLVNLVVPVSAFATTLEQGKTFQITALVETSGGSRALNLRFCQSELTPWFRRQPSFSVRLTAGLPMMALPMSRHCLALVVLKV